MMNTVSKFKWFWAWDDEKEEDYLREMALDGWHFQSVTFPGFYTFEKGMPRNDFYRLDFLVNHRDKENYLQLFKDAGWSHVGEYGSWQYFRKTAVEGETPEIFTDNDSKVKKYGRVMTFLIIFLPIYIVLLTRVNEASSTFYKIITFVLFLFLLLYTYAMVMLMRRIGQLRKRS
jgi:hypothetical protein